jgi:parvulin-like peptidyl-prolyl isomerase
MEYRIISLMIAVSLLFFAGCTKPAAVVNGEKIDKKTFDQRLNEKIQRHKDLGVSFAEDRLKNAVLQELIAEVLIMEAAAEKGINISEDEVSSQIESMKSSTGEEDFNKRLKEKGLALESLKKRTRNEMIMSKFVESLADNDAVSEQEVRDFYNNSSKPFIKPGRVFIKLIEFKGEESAREVLERMENEGIKFDDIAGVLSREQKAIVSDYGWVNPDVFSPSISGAIKNLEPGEYGGPYKGRKGVFLIRIKDREEETVAKFEEVRDEIWRTLIAQKRQAALAHLIAERKRKAVIKINI